MATLRIILIILMLLTNRLYTKLVKFWKNNYISFIWKSTKKYHLRWLLKESRGWFGCWQISMNLERAQSVAETITALVRSTWRCPRPQRGTRVSLQSPPGWELLGLWGLSNDGSAKLTNGVCLHWLTRWHIKDACFHPKFLWVASVGS